MEQLQPGYSAPYCGAGGGGAGGAAATVENDGIGTGGAGVQVLIAGSPTLTGVGAPVHHHQRVSGLPVVAVVEVMFRNLMYQWFLGEVEHHQATVYAGGGIGGGGAAPNAIGGQGVMALVVAVVVDRTYKCLSWRTRWIRYLHNSLSNRRT